MSQKIRLALLVTVALSLVSVSSVLGQETRILRGELSGTITDSTGARVPDVEVSATHQESTCFPPRYRVFASTAKLESFWGEEIARR